LESLATQGFDHLVEVHRVLEGFAVDAEGTVGLAADVAGDLEAFQRFLHRRLEAVVAEVLDQHLDHVAHFDLALVMQAGSGQRLVGFLHQHGRGVEAFLGFARAQPAGGAGGDDVLAGQVGFGLGEVARVDRDARQLAALAVADRGAAAVPVGDLGQLDVERRAHGVGRHQVVRGRGLELG
jgi:hypothetical protein